MSHPYTDAAPHQRWSQAMSWVAPGQVDPVGASIAAWGGPRIGPSDRVATLGSCFAQHIARHLPRSGGRHFVVEAAPPGLDAATAEARQYGLFSARYGNVYTVRQALQLFDRAHGRFSPQAVAWARGERFVDPFRPQVDPQGHADAAAVARERDAHLARVRELFAQCDWLVFTLGLTEAWRDRRDGAVFPMAPGVAGGGFDPALHEFVNFDIDEVRADLDAFVTRIAAVNPRCRVLLTVSPVPLVATFEPRHVWVSTTHSKAVLRVAADHACRRHAQVGYFPSYEVITSPAAGGRYWADDLRQVTDDGVQHVMRLFTRHLMAGGESRDGGPAQVSAVGPGTGLPAGSDVVCDEEVLERALQAAGHGRR